jgi:hypothetical protein
MHEQKVITESALFEMAKDSYKPPKQVRRNAALALQVRQQKPPSERGMLPAGLARARDLANGRALTLKTLKRMVNFFTRHEVDKKGSTWGERGKGWQAWYGWGGDEGWAWARRIVNASKRVEESEQMRSALMVRQLHEALLSSQLTVGFELEGYVKKTDVRAVEAVANKYGLVMGRDGSIRPPSDLGQYYAYEIDVGYGPLTPSWLKEVTNIISDFYDAGMRTNSSCGFHAHFGFIDDSMSRFERTLTNFLVIAYIIQNNMMDAKGLLTFNGISQENNIYASLEKSRKLIEEYTKTDYVYYVHVDSDGFVKYINDVAALYAENKYVLLNSHSQGTIEWRGLRGILMDDREWSIKSIRRFFTKHVYPFGRLLLHAHEQVAGAAGAAGVVFTTEDGSVTRRVTVKTGMQRERDDISAQRAAQAAEREASEKGAFVKAQLVEQAQRLDRAIASFNKLFGDVKPLKKLLVSLEPREYETGPNAFTSIFTSESMIDLVELSRDILSGGVNQDLFNEIKRQAKYSIGGAYQLTMKPGIKQRRMNQGRITLEVMRILKVGNKILKDSLAFFQDFVTHPHRIAISKMKAFFNVDVVASLGLPSEPDGEVLHLDIWQTSSTNEIPMIEPLDAGSTSLMIHFNLRKEHSKIHYHMMNLTVDSINTSVSPNGFPYTIDDAVRTIEIIKENGLKISVKIKVITFLDRGFDINLTSDAKNLLRNLKNIANIEVGELRLVSDSGLILRREAGFTL